MDVQLSKLSVFFDIKVQNHMSCLVFMDTSVNCLEMLVKNSHSFQIQSNVQSREIYVHFCFDLCKSNTCSRN